MRIPLDPESQVVQECFAIVYAPRRARDRFPESCVEIVATEAAARAAADATGKRFAARVMGPSRSSEGFQLYYLVQWLDP